MTPASFQILKACAVAFSGVLGFGCLSLLVHRGIKKDALMAGGGGLPLILPLGQFATLGVSFSMLGSVHFTGIAFLVLSYASAVGAVFFINQKYSGNEK